MILKQNETSYMRRDTVLANYLPYPIYLFTLGIPATSKLFYALLLNRATLSQKNGWIDEEDRVYIVYTIEAMAADMKKSKTTVKESLTELSRCGLLERKRSGFGKPNKLYVKLIESRISDGMQAEKPAFAGTEKDPYRGQNKVTGMDGFSTPNNYINNFSYNNLSGATEKRVAYGRYQNIFLSEDEYEELRKAYPDHLSRFIEEMSSYLAATGKTYANYEAGLRMWASEGYGASENL